MGCASLLVWAGDTYIPAMTTDQIMQLSFLTLMGGAIFVSYVVSQKGNWGKTAQQAALWGLIFVGTIGAVGLWGDIRNTVAPRQSVATDGTITVPQAPDGHYYLTLQLNGAPVDFVVDTGATMMVLTQNDAQQIGLDPDNLRYSGQASTANGIVRTAGVFIDSVTLGDQTDRNVRAVVNGGELDTSLLGMSYLDGFGDIRFSGGEMTLTR